MPNDLPIRDLLDDLRCEVDELTTKMLLGSGSTEALSSLSESLQVIRQLADKAETKSVVDIVTGLEAEMNLLDSGSNVEQLLEPGIARLRQALELAATTLPAPNAGKVQATAISQDRELLGDFVQESREHLATIETQLLELERNPSNTEAIHAIFRGFHTIKGLAGFLELSEIREVAHEVETVLDRARNNDLEITAPVIDVVLESADYLKHAVKRIDAELHDEQHAGNLPDLRSLVDRVLGLTRAEVSSQPAQTMAQPVTTTSARPNPAPNAAESRFVIRIDTTKLDHLLDLVGELVIAQSLVQNDPSLAKLDNPRLQSYLTQLARITEDVQKTSMDLRMLPVGQLFGRMSRLVRDLSRKAGKQVSLEWSGEDTELDKTLVDGLADPLMHMVRNALDHGLERPDERLSAGKPAMGHLWLRASHQSGHIVIEVADDGRGLNREKILKKAAERGLISDRAQLSDNDIWHLIFEPGFSTAEQVTDISGRGVGMDVVKKNIQKMRGRVDIETVPGVGTTFQIKLPLTLAIIEGLVIGVGIHRYIMPLFSVSEMFRPSLEAVSTVQGTSEMVIVRGRLLPIVRLYQRFGISPRNTDPSQCLLIVTECEGKPYCLMVDEFIGKQEVVIKSLGECFRNVSGIAGGAILGDGRVGLILDAAAIFRSRH